MTLTTPKMTVDLDAPNEDNINVKISVTDNRGRMSLNFSKRIKLPGNYTLWTSENEGQERLSIKYLPSEGTKNKVYDELTDLKYTWKVHNYSS